MTEEALGEMMLALARSEGHAPPPPKRNRKQEALSLLRSGLSQLEVSRRVGVDKGYVCRLAKSLRA